MTILELQGAGFAYGSRRVLDDISVSLSDGDSLGLVGESGAGKSTILRLMLGLAAPRDGQVLFDGAPLSLRDRAQMRRFRASVQPVFQDPYSSLDPRQRIDRIIGEPLRSLGPGVRCRRPAPHRRGARFGRASRRHRAPGTRMSSPAVSVSASRSRGPWCRARGCCWPTSR